MVQLALEVKHLVKKYGERIAVNDLSFTVKKGEFFGFLGPNGAGKTSTINAIVGIGNFQAGEIKILGHDVIREYREARRKIGISPQEFNTDLFATPRKILDFVGGYFGMRKAEREAQIEYLLTRLGLAPYQDISFRALSGGFKRRMMLARAMMHNPEILILDEPTAGVDVELRYELWRLLAELNQNGKTIFLTTHYLEEAQRLCKRIGIIFNGKLVQLESKEELIKDGSSIEDHYLRHAELQRENNVIYVPG